MLIDHTRKSIPDSVKPCTTILCFVAYYLPGYQSGGPVRTIANFVEHLGDEFDIRVVTRDRDALNTRPYPGVQVDAWNTVGKAQVYYASEQTVNLRGIARIMSETPHDVLYLNSFFSVGFTLLPLLVCRLGLVPKRRIVIAPRGEFSVDAVGIKAWKKRPYIALAKALGLYAKLHWQASSANEVEDIRHNLKRVANTITIASNLPPASAGIGATAPDAEFRKPGPLRIVFLSRISPMKNLDFLLRVLCRVSSTVELSIFGPIREPSYWKYCQSIMTELPSNVVVEYVGEITPQEVLDTLSKFDLFAFPTRGENYGHVILESLMAGTPVLTSDQTPWKGSADMAVEVIGLDDMDAWTNVIERWAHYEESDFQRMELAARDYAQKYLSTSEAVQQNRELFSSCIPA